MASGWRRSLKPRSTSSAAQNVIAFIAETVVGATLGAVPAVPGYFKRVREICDRHGILLILDEVMCGMGRTGTLHACEQDGVSPDIMAIAKGLGGGYMPIGAMLLHDKIFKAIADGSGAFQHSHTYTGHPLACAAALAVQRVIRRDDLLANVRKQGAHLSRRLQERFGNHPFVGDVRGRGLFQGVELVADRGTKEPFDPQRKLHARIKQRGHGARTDGISDGRNGRWRARRSCAAGAAVHHRRRCNRSRSSKGWEMQSTPQRRRNEFTNRVASAAAMRRNSAPRPRYVGLKRR